jgi:hypothetical protein
MIVCGRTALFRSAEAFQKGPWMASVAGLLFTVPLSSYLARIRENNRRRTAMEQRLVGREELFRQMTETVDEALWSPEPGMTLPRSCGSTSRRTAISPWWGLSFSDAGARSICLVGRDIRAPHLVFYQTPRPSKPSSYAASCGFENTSSEELRITFRSSTLFTAGLFGAVFLLASVSPVLGDDGCGKDEGGTSGLTSPAIVTEKRMG